MKIIKKEITVKTKGSPELLDITPEVKDVVESYHIKEGLVTVFVVGSTAGITTFEYEPGLIDDVKELYEKIIPQHKHYHHDDTWSDANGYSHLRASLTGPSLSIPFSEGRLSLGVWQQVVLAEFDNRPRQRQIILQIIGE